MARQSHPPDQATVLLTRPEPGGTATAEALRRAVAGAAILLSPLMAVEYQTPDLPERDFSAIIFTSRAGVAAAVRLQAEGARLPGDAFAVGDGTATAARKAGFSAQSARGDAEALLALVKRHRPGGALLHLRGRDARETLATGLVSAGIETVSVVGYAQVAQPLTPAAVRLLSGDSRVILPLFSPRSAALFLQATADQTPLAPIDLVMMSEAVAKTASRIVAQHRSIATEPTEAAMVQSVVTRLRQNPDLNGTASDH